MRTASTKPPTVLVTGATGYVGGRLVPRLLDAGYRVRALARSPRKLADRFWIDDPGVEVVEGDLSETETDVLAGRMRGSSTAYYLVHAMLAAGEEYAQRDREMAQRFVQAAERAEISRIVYLGGLGEAGEGLSQHLDSRMEVAEILSSGRVPVTTLRAAMILGSGSASFEILRYLVERLPVMITPKWVSTECQPIGVRDVLGYLIECLETPETVGETLDIGGPEILTYRRILEIMAEECGLRRRWILPVPVLTPKLSSLWIHLVTPLSRHIARPLAEGLKNRVVCRDDRARRWMPRDLLTVRQAIRLALRQVETRTVETTWSMAGWIPGDPDWSGGTVFTDRREEEIDAPPSVVFRAVCRVGGGHGWYAADWLWRIRGFVDRLVGGPGLRRGRRDPEKVAYGEALDFWRVTEVETDRRLALRAEMKLPGEALLELDLEPRSEDSAHPSSGTHLTMTARFLPRGLLGLVYWYAVLPLHRVVFRGMLKGIRRAAENATETTAPPHGC